MQVNFKVYPRKIDVYILAKSYDEYTNKIGNERYVYLHSTNAYPTCKAATAALNPDFKYKAHFAK